MTDRSIPWTVRLTPEPESEPAPPLRRGERLQSAPLARHEDAVSRPSVRAQSDQNPSGKGITPPSPPDGSDSAYCTGCAHDWSRHRTGRCWTGPMGEPLYRTRSLITCLCTDERTKP